MVVKVMPSIKLNISLDSEVYSKIKEIAVKDDRTVSNFIGVVLKKYINEKR